MEFHGALHESSITGWLIDRGDAQKNGNLRPQKVELLKAFRAAKWERQRNA